MKYLHYEFNVRPSDLIQVKLREQANVKLLDEVNYQRYRAGQEHKYFGGLAKKSPVNMRAPSQGHWHIVIDLGGYAGTVHASARVISG